MWYWVCEGLKEHRRIAFNVIECTDSKIKANLLLIKKKNKNTNQNVEYWIREDVEHWDRDYKQYRCPECGFEMSKRELDDAWDWAGPHCINCGCTGVTMFQAVMKKPIITGYQAIRAKFASVLRWKKLEEIDKEVERKRNG